MQVFKLALGLIVFTIVILIAGRYGYRYLEQRNWFVGQSLPIVGRYLPAPELTEAFYEPWSIRSVDPRRLDFSTFKDPFLREPCYVSSDKTCQPVLELRSASESPSGYNSYVFQTQENRAFQSPTQIQAYTWVIWPDNNVLSQTIVSQYDAVTYQKFIDQVLQTSWDQHMNPGIVWAFFLRVGAIQPELFKQPTQRNWTQIIGGWRTARTSMKDPQGTLAQAISDLEWTAEGKAVLYYSLRYLDIATVEKLFSQPGWLENTYQEQFILPYQGKTFRFSLTSEVASPELAERYVSTQATNEVMICHYEQAYRCVMTSGVHVSDDLEESTPLSPEDITWWHCQTATEANALCDSYWLQNIQEL